MDVVSEALVKLVDLHAHVPNDTFANDLHTWVEKWKQAGVQNVVSVAMDLEQSRQSIILSEKYDMILSATGIHPWEVKAPVSDGTLEKFRELVNKSDLIGEVGLDYHFVEEEKYYPYQYDFFEEVLQLAKDLDKPLTIHSKGAEEDIVRLIDETGISSHLLSIHWYSGPAEVLDQLIDMGISFSIGPAIKYQQSHRRVVENTPIDKLLVESDGDVKYRGMLGHPGMMYQVIKEIAKIIDMDPQKTSAIIYQNSLRFLRIKPS